VTGARRKGQAGVTLIELLIAVSLVGLISIGLLMAMRVGLSAMDKTNTHVIENRRVLGVQRVLESQIGAIIPVKAPCLGAGGAPFGFFEGGPDRMRFVSSYSLEEAARGYARVLEFKVIPGEHSAGVRLIVNERLYTGPLSVAPLCIGLTPDPATGKPAAQFPDIETGANSFVLADRLAYCRILYRETMPPPELERWRPNWTDGNLLPSGIRVEMAPLEPDPAGLTLMDVTVPMHITRHVMEPYVD
jgi:prepilin-type N-terminal cleavage/methylation domain-containing protein